MTFQPFHTDGADRPARWLVTCDHARNTVPDFVSGGCLGLAAGDMGRHIAYDVGAEGVARELARLLNAPYIGTNFSRLVIDPNRGEDDPTLIMQIYDGSIIPGNASLTETDKIERLDHLYRPYHAAVARAAGPHNHQPIVSVHSFTPQLRGRAHRPWHIGLLTAGDRRLADPMFTALARERHLVVGDNEPYTGALKGDAMDRHGVQAGRPHVLVEIRSDLIETSDGQKEWAERLATSLLHARDVALPIAQAEPI